MGKRKRRKKKYPIETNAVIHGDCYDVLSKFPSSLFDFVITDPPCLSTNPKDIRELLIHWLNGDEYFSGKKLVLPGPKVWQQIFRVLKPGGYIISLADPKIYDLMSVLIRITGTQLIDKIDVHCDESYLSWIHDPVSAKSKKVEKEYEKAGRKKRKWKGYETALKTAHKSILKFARKQGKKIRSDSFYYASKPPKDDRNLGCEDLKWCNKSLVPDDVYQMAQKLNEKSKGIKGFKSYSLKEGNVHSQSKPLSLCRYLVKMLMPPNGGLMLDPFCGSGSFLCAAMTQGCEFVGIDIDSTSCIISNARIKYYKESHGS